MASGEHSSPNTHVVSRTTKFAWALCGMIIVGSLISLGIQLANRPLNDNVLKVSSVFAWSIYTIINAAVGALIISRQPRNGIGWLLFTPPLVFVMASPIEMYLETFTSAPPPTIPILLMAWINNWSWLLLIFPILLILLLFPTGRPPSPRWRWVLYLALGMVIFFVFLVTFSETIQLFNRTGSWNLPNPIGFITDNPALNTYIFTSWSLSLLLLTVLCAASVFVRYRRASAVEREQIKWLVFAAAVFVVVYVPLLAFHQDGDNLFNDATDLLLSLSVSLFPIAIGVAILRYRLWEIDVLIRRTLVYSALTATLTLFYLGSVVVLQALIQGITGKTESPAAVVISTLGIAALFTPLRRRIQNDIDRRFYRRKYDARRTVEAYTRLTQTEVDLDELTHHLVESVERSLQPEHVSLWLHKGQ